MTAITLTNLFLAALPDAEREQILAVATEVTQGTGDQIAEPEKPFDNVYFPIDSVTSVLTVLSDGKAVESATVGFEGFVPIAAILDAKDEPTSTTVVQVPGRSLVVSLEDFRRLRSLPAFNTLAMKYLHAYMSMMAQNVACNRAHPLEERCARWILIAHDRARRDRFEMTQDYLAGMLGVTRPSVTVAAGILHKAGFITYHRGVVEVLDRDGLEASACECYGVISEGFRTALAR
jgi:CRP-like cAMP-binding protein